MAGRQTPTRRAIFEAIVAYKSNPDSLGNAPTLAEIAGMIGKSRGAVNSALRRMAANGEIKIGARKHILLPGERYSPPPPRSSDK